MTLIPLNPALGRTFAPPVMEASRWIRGVTFPDHRPLINVAQAAPIDPPPEALRRAVADAALNRPEAHMYGPDLGLPELRAEIATVTSAHYNGTVTPDQVAITAGCNQAFCAAIATLAGAGDEVIVPTPWYFNHKMWLDMSGITTVPLATGTDLLPDPDRVASLITPRTKALVLVSPNNPAGVEYPAELLRTLHDLCRKNGIVVIVDETYRDFDSRTGRPHDLFTDPDWSDNFIHLYSFSKAYRLTGHRVGAMIASAERLAEVEKFIDTVTICPNQLGQMAALWGMRNLGEFVAGERAELLIRRQAMIDGFGALDGWKMLGCGGYFAYVEHGAHDSSHDFAQRLILDASVLCLPGTMFMPTDDPRGQRQLRIAYANVSVPMIDQLMARLKAVSL